mmetsp:Transcript_8802/g.16616  ORF Transcript_8802/g.16616 Transcript_8802/m.16616 type:complete len:238 (+) Transcript_8802:3606-4319(+)
MFIGFQVAQCNVKWKQVTFFTSLVHYIYGSLFYKCSNRFGKARARGFVKNSPAIGILDLSKVWPLLQDGNNLVSIFVSNCCAKIPMLVFEFFRFVLLLHRNLNSLFSSSSSSSSSCCSRLRNRILDDLFDARLFLVCRRRLDLLRFYFFFFGCCLYESFFFDLLDVLRFHVVGLFAFNHLRGHFLWFFANLLSSERNSGAFPPGTSKIRQANSCDFLHDLTLGIKVISNAGKHYQYK